MITLLLFGLLLLGAGMVSLVFAITYIEDGYEDMAGFHRLPSSETEARQWQPVSNPPWDQIEGATCPLNVGQ